MILWFCDCRGSTVGKGGRSWLTWRDETHLPKTLTNCGSQFLGEVSSFPFSFLLLPVTKRFAESVTAAWVDAHDGLHLHVTVSSIHGCRTTPSAESGRQEHWTYWNSVCASFLKKKMPYSMFYTVSRADPLGKCRQSSRRGKWVLCLWQISVFIPKVQK